MKAVYKIVPMLTLIMVLISGCSPKTCDVTIMSKDKKITKQRMVMPISLDTDEFATMYVSDCK